MEDQSSKPAASDAKKAKPAGDDEDTDEGDKMAEDEDPLEGREPTEDEIKEALKYKHVKEVEAEKIRNYHQ